MEVDMGYRLMSWYSVVLPNGNAWSLVRPVDRCGGALDRSDQRSSFGVPNVKNRRAMPNWNNQEVGNASLLPRDERRDHAISLNDRVRPIATQESTE
jgi:hypothetical protein